MPTALYRKSSGEVVKVSLTDQPFSDVDSTVWGVLINPALPDGSDVRDTSTEPAGPLRQLGFAKIAQPGPLVRNATQPEIDTFAPAQVEDENQQDANRAGDLWDTDPQTRKLFAAFADIVIDELNTLRAREMQFQADVAAAASLGDLKASVAAYPPLNPRTLAQLKTAVRNRISKDD